MLPMQDEKPVVSAKETSPQAFRTLDISSIPGKVCDVVRAFYADYPPGVLVPHSFLPVHLRVPHVDLRLAQATGMLQRAISISVVKDRDCGAQHVYSKLQALQTMTPEAPTPFYFYIAGGYVVSQMLGLGQFTDIVLFTKPFPVKSHGSGFLVASGKGAYPVTVAAVSSMEAFLESFDMHICCCAILCCVIENRVRGYELYLTKNCAIARKCRGVHACPLHPIMVSASLDVNDRMRLYWYGLTSRNTNMMDEIWPERGLHFRFVALDPPLPQHREESLCFSTSTGACHWIVGIKDWKIHSICLAMGMGASSISLQQASNPVVVYHCRQHAFMSTSSSEPPEAHWILKAMARGDRNGIGLIAFRGGSRTVSSVLVPEWLVDRLHRTESEIVDDLIFATRRNLVAPVFISIPCAVPIKVLAHMTDWNCDRSVANNSRILGSMTWCYFVDAPELPYVRTVMSCVETHQLCSSCKHRACSEYKLHAKLA